jgi:hypothetical protein
MADDKVIASPILRRASAEDANKLSAFSCGNTEWAQEVESFIRNASLLCHLGDPPALHYAHTLVVAENVDGEIIGVAAVRRGPIRLFNGSEIVGLVLVVVAVASGVQGAIVENDGKLSYVLVNEAVRSAARGRRAREPVYGIVDYRNTHSVHLLQALGFEALEFGAVGSYHDVYYTTTDSLLDTLTELT